ncbi:nuclear transport factor 2 family protein [Amycolatopsis sp. K13G38]|uniref:Nuclear transport factor 2 family protein n=1 Tax=Amycolatopsis acididurans TaxID=2724524 RepID=A0ABX1J8Q2_9PSEU|nr:nuclear transport factor 2 family protein [Amycolatopsis acididurans]NKQ56157.1 nuclear transport factor 2 family protein [Amycolatopsis acididurans]
MNFAATSAADPRRPLGQRPDAAAIEQSFLRRFATDWFDAWNSRDTDRVLALVHPDVIWEDSAFWREPIEGRKNVRAYVERIWQIMPDVEFEEIQSFTAPSDGRGVLLYRHRGSGPPGVAPDRRFDVTGCVVFMEFVDGLLSWYVTQYDLNEIKRQLGTFAGTHGPGGPEVAATA